MGFLVGPYGAWEQGQAAAGAAHYNAEVAGQNAAIQRVNAQIAEQSGQAQAGIQGQKTKAMIAGTTGHQAASGVDVSSGSYGDVRNSERAIGEVDSYTIRSNAARQAFGYRTAAAGQTAEQTLKGVEGANATAMGGINAASTFISEVSNTAGSFAKFQAAGGLGGGGGMPDNANQ